MKKNIILALLMVTGIMVNAQISGAFYQGSNYIYFEGTNTTAYPLNITIECVNEQLNQRLSFNLTPLYSGNSFTIGPEVGWEWQAGEKLYVTYSNGRRVYWKCDKSMKYSSSNNIDLGSQLNTRSQNELNDIYEKSLNYYKEVFDKEREKISKMTPEELQIYQMQKQSQIDMQRQMLDDMKSNSSNSQRSSSSRYGEIDCSQCDRGVCGTCKGNGYISSIYTSDNMPCSSCVKYWGNNRKDMWGRCHYCNGTGKRLGVK